MKKLINSLFSVFLAAFVLSCANTTVPDINVPAYYLSIDDVVNSADFLPAPPDSGSVVWQMDVERYQQGKSLRDTERGRQALRDAFVQNDSLAQAFSEAFGFEISPVTTPATYRLISHMREDAGDLSTRHAKQLYMRQRPFMVFDEPTPLPQQEIELRNNGSYPSGHSAIGYAVALVLSEINPERAFHIMKRGYEMGESRVILGFHFDSDVRAGRECASMLIPVLHSNPEFLHDLEAAKREAAALRSGSEQSGTAQ